MKEACNCNTIDEIRSEIDIIDKEVIGLLGKRFQYVKEIVRFKSDSNEVKAPIRYHEVIESRRNWAIAHGLDANIIEKMYTDLIHYFIEEEMKMLHKK